MTFHQIGWVSLFVFLVEWSLGDEKLCFLLTIPKPCRSHIEVGVLIKNSYYIVPVKCKGKSLNLSQFRKMKSYSFWFCQIHWQDYLISWFCNFKSLSCDQFDHLTQSKTCTKTHGFGNFYRCFDGWSGGNCSTCMPSAGCLHGTCGDTPLTCQCEDGWEGALCDMPVCE